MKKLLVPVLALLLSAGIASAASNVAPDPELAYTEALSASVTVNFPIDGFPQQFRVQTAGTFLEVKIFDCCIEGDQWVVRAINMNGGVQDVRGIGSGIKLNSLPPPESPLWNTLGAGYAILYKLGGLNIDAIVEFRASKSNAVSPSSAYARFRSNADVTFQALTPNTTIFRLPIAPLPLPSQ